MENLNKENFWNELQEKYPDGMKIFCDWIDKYKRDNDWGNLFNFGTPHYAKQGWHDPKFHDIPLAMQIGIWIQFSTETFLSVHEWEIEDMNNHDWQEDIRGAIKLLHEDKTLREAIKNNQEV